MNVETKVTVNFQTTLVLNEVEIRALEAMTSYGIDAFLKVFYEKLGKCYMQPYEAGLRALFIAVNNTVHPAIGEINRHKKALNEALAAQHKEKTK